MARRQTREYLTATFLALLLWAGGTVGAGAGDLQTPRFVDVAAAAGVEHAYTGDWTHYVGGGVAAFDCDLDGDPDLFFAGGASPAQLYRNDSEPGALRFSAVADSELVETGVTGAYPLDIDGDGMMDIAVLRQGANRLHRGLGDCRFAGADEAWGVPGGDRWTTAFSAVWEGDNRLPTLAFGNYVDRDMWAAMHTPFGDSATGEAPTPACPDNVLFRPAEPDAERYGPPVRLSPGHCPLSMLFSDWSRAGRADLRISNDRFYHEDTGEEQLWHLGAEPRLYGRADGWPRLRIWGMGIASHDLTGDGLPDYFLSNMGTNRLRTLAPGSTGGPEFREIAFEHGVEATRPHAGDDERPSTAWHSQFADVNNDGWIDLFVAKGNVEEMEEAAAEDPNNLLLGGPDGRFREASVEAGAASMRRSRGGAVIDLDLDGLLDIVVVNRMANVELLHNRSRVSGHWLQVMLRQEEANRNAIGAWIEVRTAGRIQRHEVVVGGGHVSGQAGWIHFGLGAADAVEIRVQWPDGTWSPWRQSAINRFLLIERGVEWLPRVEPDDGMDDWIARKDLIEARRLKALSRRSDLLGWLQVLSQLGAAGIVGFGIHVLWGSWWVAPLFVAQGVILWGFCYAGQHELGHWTVFRNRTLNDAFGHLASFPRFYAHNYQRFFHFAHHRHTKVAGHDPELLVQKPWTFMGYLKFVSGLALWIALIRNVVEHAFGHAPEPFLREKERRIVIREARLYLLGYAAVVALSVYFESWAALICVWGPMVLTTFFYRLYVAAEHHGLPNGRGVIGSTRTTRAGPILRWLMWQMPYHTEHHLFPGVPFHKLGALSRELRERPDSKLAGINDVAPGYIAVNLKLLAMLRRGEDPTFLAEAARA